jgi:hypothetical protein
MATNPANTRTERVVVLMTPSEKRDVAERALAAGVSTGEYMRLAAQFGAMSPAEQAELVALTQELDAMNARLDRSFASLESTANRVIDEEALRARYRAEFEAWSEDDRSALADFFSGRA